MVTIDGDVVTLRQATMYVCMFSVCMFLYRDYTETDTLPYVFSVGTQA